MRNEIFRQINQNKIQYYSELKNDKKEKIINIESLQNEITNEASEKKDFRYSVLKVFRTTSNKRLAGVILNVCDQITDLLGRTRLHISSINNKLSNKVNIHSNRLTEGLTQISSQLFEDRYEYQQQNTILKNRGQISYDDVQTLAVPLQVNNDSVQAQFVYWLNKLYIRIILFLESDEWFEKIEQSQQISSIQKHHNQLKDRILYSCQKINKSLFSSRTLKYKIALFNVKENSFSNYINDSGKVKERFIYMFFRSRFKSLSKAIFPAINRFI